MRYFVKTPWWLIKIYPHRLWQVETKENFIYLTFDDGPHPTVTPFVLDELKKYKAKATFFCIGKNVVDNPVLYRRIIDEGHSVGNHTQQHLNGWKTNNENYLSDVAIASEYIQSNLFRPPYGRLKSFQAKGIGDAMKNKLTKIVMWDVLSGDFDDSLNNEQCFSNVINNTSTGSIVVFHDSEKAFSRLQYTLPRTLEFFSSKGYVFKELEMQ